MTFAYPSIPRALPWLGTDFSFHVTFAMELSNTRHMLTMWAIYSAILQTFHLISHSYSNPCPFPIWLRGQPWRTLICLMVQRFAVNWSLLTADSVNGGDLLSIVLYSRNEGPTLNGSEVLKAARLSSSTDSTASHITTSSVPPMLKLPIRRDNKSVWIRCSLHE